MPRLAGLKSGMVCAVDLIGKACFSAGSESVKQGKAGRQTNVISMFSGSAAQSET
jgi:hypothetical protein